jgi:biuret amidohydrolase
VRRAADLGFLPVIVADACGSCDVEARLRSLDRLGWAGDTLITGAATIATLMRCE